MIENRIAKSGILTLDLAKYYPTTETLVFDLKGFLYMELILKEKEFRKALKEHNFEQYKNKNVAITCTADAIVPLWAYMLVASYLEGQAIFYTFGSAETLQTILFAQNLQQIDVENYRDKRVVIKGCGDKSIPAAAYIEITHLLKPVVKSLMYGEPCSTVPIYKTTTLKQKS